LPYLEAVIKETLRHHPPIHICNRRIVRDVEFGGYRLPAGRRLLFSIYLTQHDPAVWARPEVFDPQRFYQAGAEAARPALSYLPFGAGPRFCVGAAFAQLEVRAVLTYVLQRFDLAPGPGRVHGDMGATLTPHPAVRLTIRRVAEGPDAARSLENSQRSAELRILHRRGARSIDPRPGSNDKSGRR
jgi:cytochrome P450